MKGATGKRRAAYRRGTKGEGRAAALLRLKGYRIVARRWRSPAGEIDLIARKGATLVFVEVKARASLDQAAESVTPHQRERIARAAEAFIAFHPEIPHENVRLDAVLIAPARWPRHLEAAWLAGN